MDMYRENIENMAPSQEKINTLFSTTNILIFLLCVLLLFSILGINILTLSGHILQEITHFIIQLYHTIKPFMISILSVLGYTTGSTLNKTADIVANTGKTSLDIADGSIHSLGNLFIQSSLPNLNKNHIDTTLNASPIKINNPSTDTTSSPIQNPISSNKTNWCLVGDYAGKRGCIEIGESDKCLSNQIYPTQQLCLNPNTRP
jgi:hypothetical protein